MPRAPEEPRWNDRTTLHLVQFDYADQVTLRAVRLTGDAVRVGAPVRVSVSGVEVEGRIAAIDGTILRVELSTPLAKKKMAKAKSFRAQQRRRGKAS